MLYLRPKLTYPVSCTSLTEKQCRYIQAPALAALLPIMHLNHHTPHAIIFGDPRYGGLNLPDFYTVQGFQQLRLLIGHLSSQDDVGKMILIAISYLQLTLGVHRPFFIMQYSLFAKWIDKLWLTLVWQHTSQLQIVLEIEKQWMPHQPRTHDTFLMEYALTLNLLACSIKLINQCCLYLLVLTLLICPVQTANTFFHQHYHINDPIKPAPYCGPFNRIPPRKHGRCGITLCFISIKTEDCTSPWDHGYVPPIRDGLGSLIPHTGQYFS